MAGIGLSSIINSNFVNRFTGIAGGSTSKSITSALNGSSATISDGLRIGARTMGAAVQGLNATISFVNISQSALENLGELTDKMIGLAERASRVSTGASSRRDLDAQFRKLAKEFQKTVENAKIGTKEFTTEDGLSEIFKIIGLDKDSSDTIKALFKEFQTPKEDSSLASEQTKGPRPIKVPPASFRTAVSDTVYSMQKVTDAGVVSAGQATDGGSVFITNDDILNQNPGYDSIFIKNTDGTITSLQAGFLDRSFDKLQINEKTGSTLIGTTQDLGGNAAHDYTAYLVDKNGATISNFGQFTLSAPWSVISQHDFQISADDSKIGYIQEEERTDIGEYRYSIKTKTTSSSSTVDFATYQYSLGDPVQSIDTLKMANDGTTFLYNRFDGSTGDYYTTSNIASPWLTPANGILNSCEFVANDKFVFIDGGTSQVKSYTLGDAVASADLTTGLSGIAHLSATQATAGNSGYFAVDSDIGGGARRASLYSVASTTPLFSLDITSAESISALSIGYNALNEAELGVLGNLGAHNGDTDTELYRFLNNSQHTNGRRSSRMSDASSALFAETTNLRTRPDAFRVLTDLKALRDQIKKNLHALDDALVTVGKNLDLVRETGLAMLDLSGSIKSSDDADYVAQQLRTKISQNAGAALSQAENLNPIIVASLTLDSNSFK